MMMVLNAVDDDYGDDYDDDYDNDYDDDDDYGNSQ